METFLLSLVVLLYLMTSRSLMYAQSDFAKNYVDIRSFSIYENTKNDKAMALGWFGVLPGAGIYYSHADPTAFVYTVLDVSLLLAYLNAKNGDFFLIALIISRIVELVNTLSCVDDYNYALRRKVRLVASLDKNFDPRLTLSLNF